MSHFSTHEAPVAFIRRRESCGVRTRQVAEKTWNRSSRRLWLNLYVSSRYQIQFTAWQKLCGGDLFVLRFREHVFNNMMISARRRPPPTVRHTTR